MLLWNTLYSLPVGVTRTVVRLFLHVLPIWGSVLQFPGDKWFPLPRHCELGAGVRVEGIP